MQRPTVISETELQREDVLLSFTSEAERLLCALFNGVRELHGESAALCIADGWLDILEARLAKCGTMLPGLQEITVRSIACFLAPCADANVDAAAAILFDDPCDQPQFVRSSHAIR